MHKFEIAQLNIAELRFPLDAPEVVDFVDNLDRINTLGEQSPGFVWRLQTEQADAAALEYFGDNCIVNLTVWRSIEALKQFVYRSDHVDFIRRKGEWFSKMQQAHLVLWWVDQGHRPDLVEARQKLDQLRRHGPTADAFTLSEHLAPPA